jgi:hypothetical protein
MTSYSGKLNMYIENRFYFVTYKMKLICKTAYFKQLEEGKEYLSEDQRMQELCKQQVEMVAIRIN